MRDFTLDDQGSVAVGDVGFRFVAVSIMDPVCIQSDSCGRCSNVSLPMRGGNQLTLFRAENENGAFIYLLRDTVWQSGNFLFLFILPDNKFLNCFILPFLAQTPVLTVCTAYWNSQCLNFVFMGFIRFFMLIAIDVFSRIRFVFEIELF